MARDAGGAVAGYSALCEPGALPVGLLRPRPGGRGLARAPAPRAARARPARPVHPIHAGLHNGERPGPEVAALYLDLKRTYLQMRPALVRVYTCARDATAMGPTLEPLGFAPFDDDPPRLDGVAYTSYCNDFGPGSVDGWLAGLAAREVLGGDEPLLDDDARTVVVDGDRVALTPLEFGVLRCLDEHAGGVVRRDVLLADVWGGSWDGDGNALEAVVSGLRRKLGARAAALETVRGVGYRLRALA